jgi:hypothetical protein
MFISVVIALNKQLYFSFVELKHFINFFHLNLSPPMPHSTPT